MYMGAYGCVWVYGCRGCGGGVVLKGGGAGDVPPPPLLVLVPPSVRTVPNGPRSPCLGEKKGGKRREQEVDESLGIIGLSDHSVEVRYSTAAGMCGNVRECAERVMVLMGVGEARARRV